MVSAGLRVEGIFLMSIGPESELDLDKLFLPAWAQEPAASKYAKYEVNEAMPDRREGRRGPRPPRRDVPGGPRDRSGDQRGPRPQGRPGGRDQRRPDDRGGHRPRFENDRGRGGADFRARREPPAPLPELTVSFVPDEKGVDSLAKQIKVTGRAYPLFDIAQMILQRPERHIVSFGIKKNAEGKPLQPLFVCALDDSLWLSENEAVEHVLKKHFGTFYQAERTATEPPKGKYTFVAQCGISGVILGPPNYHDYQTQLRKLHTERFSRMPFDTFKSRVKIVRDEETVKKWVEDQSWKTEYVCLNLPEPLRLTTMDAVQKHFREVHKDNIIKSVESHSLSGTAAKALRSPELSRLVRAVYEDQRRFPLQIATVLSQQFASRGLQFFKVNKTITHVSVARPHYLDLEATPVSDGVKKIVDYINARPRCSRRQLIEALSPSPEPLPIPVNPGAATPTVSGSEPTAPADSSAPAQSAAPAQGLSTEPTAEQTAVIADLHWLIHQGHVIEFANGTLETAKKPVPKPPKPQAKKPEAAAEQTNEKSDEHPVPGEVAPSEVQAVEAVEPTLPPEVQKTEMPAIKEVDNLDAGVQPGAGGEENIAPEQPSPAPEQNPVPSPQ
jgi:hypothetical protein